jgi:predicted transcriptional regulator
MDKNEELQKWLNDDRYVRAKDLKALWNVNQNIVYLFLSKHKIRPVKKFNIGNGGYAFYDKQQCIDARSMLVAKEQEVKQLLADNRFVTIKDLAMLWGVSNNTASVFIHAKKMQPIKRIHGGGRGISSFYDRAECERARPFINQPEQKEVEKVENIGELATATKHQILRECGADDFVWDKVTMKNKIMPVKNYCDERGNFISLFKKDETVSAILAYKNEQKQLLEKCLADKTLVTTTQLAKLWNLDKSAVYNKIYRLKIKPFAKIKLENGSMWHFYKKSDCIESQEVEKVEEKQMELPTSTEQTPDIIPADTIDLFTMSELESELKNRGVGLTADVRAKINASDMPEMKHIATMLRGNAKTIAIRLSVLNDIAGQLAKADERKNITKKAENVLRYAAQKKSLRKCDTGVLNSFGYLTNNQAFEAIRPFITKSEALEMPCFANSIIKAYLSNNKTYVVLWDKEVVQEFIANEKTKLNLIESIRPVVDCIPDQKINTITDSDGENKLDKILSRLNEIEYQIVYHENFGPSEDIINHFKSAIQSRSNVLSALMSRAKIVIHNESCVILLDQKFAVDKVGESKSKETINNALMDIGCKDFNIYVLFSGKQDVKNNQEK